MNEDQSTSPLSAIDPTADAAADDRWRSDPARPSAPPARIPAQAAPELEFRSLRDTLPDWDRVERFVSRCDPEALRSRFFVPGSMEHDDLLRLCSHYLLAGPPEGVALLASYGQEPVGLLNFIPTGPRIAEAGVLVAPRFQRRGIGRALVAELRRDPRWNGWTMRAVMQWENTAVRSLVRSLPGSRRTVSIESGCIEVDLQPFGSAEKAVVAPT